MPAASLAYSFQSLRLAKLLLGVPAFGDFAVKLFVSLRELRRSSGYSLFERFVDGEKLFSRQPALSQKLQLARAWSVQLCRRNDLQQKQ